MLDLEVIGKGATTTVYRDGDVAVKLYVDTPFDWIEHEAKVQSFARDAGLSVPAVLGVRRISEREIALDMAYVGGNPLIRPGMDKDERREAIRTLAALQCGIHQIDADGLPKQVDQLARRIQSVQGLDDQRKDALLALLRRLDDGSRNLCHGDFHPLNVLFDGVQHSIIDWVDATGGNPLADACRTYLIFKQHITRSAGTYLQMFCKQSGAKQEDVLAWLPIIAAARMTEHAADGQHEMLLRMTEFNAPT